MCPELIGFSVHRTCFALILYVSDEGPDIFFKNTHTHKTTQQQEVVMGLYLGKSNKAGNIVMFLSFTGKSIL